MDQGKMTQNYTAILLLAGRGSRIAEFTTRPKCLLDIHGKTLLERHLEIWIDAGLKDVVVVLGYEAGQIDLVLNKYDSIIRIKRVYNEDYAAKGNTYSLYLGLKEVQQGCLIFDGDLIYTPQIFQQFYKDPKESAFLVGEARLDDIECAKVMVDQEMFIRMTIDKRAVTKIELEKFKFAGEAIGIIKFSEKETKELMKITINFLAVDSNLPLNWEHLMNQFLQKRKINIVNTISEQWVEIDNLYDYQRALSLFKGQDLEH